MEPTHGRTATHVSVQTTGGMQSTPGFRQRWYGKALLVVIGEEEGTVLVET